MAKKPLASLVYDMMPGKHDHPAFYVHFFNSSCHQLS